MSKNPEPEPRSPLFFSNPGTGSEMPTKEGIRNWLLEAKMKGASHMVVVCDTYDWTDYPVSVMPEEDVHEVEKKNNDEKSMSRVMEVYWLDGDLDAQLDLRRSFTYGPPEEK